MEVSTGGATTPVINHRSGRNLIIWQDYIEACANARLPSCAAALLNMFEQFTNQQLRERVADLWISLTYEDIYHELFGTFWITGIKHHIQWLEDVGFITIRQHPMNRNGTHAYLLNLALVEQVISNGALEREVIAK